MSVEHLRETKFIGGNVVEVKEETRNGVQVGIVKGYIATWDIDRGDWTGVKDQFIKGAFLKSLAEHREKRRQIRLKDHHGRTIGGFPIDLVTEDDRGLLAVGEINLEVQQGREAHSLAKQGVLTDFSIGFSVVDSSMDNDIRSIHEAIVWEGSIVDEPMNPAAKITEVKAVVPFQDLPLADRDRPWDSDAAIARVRDFTDSDEEPSATYRRAFLWYDREDADNFGAYKLPIADVINGRLTAIPRGIFAAAAAMSGARGGVDIPENERDGVIAHINRYYEKMGLPSPFEESDKQHFVADDVKEWTPRQLEKALRGSGCFSKAAAKSLASRLKELDEPTIEPDTKGLTNILDDIKSLSESLKDRA